MCVIKILQGAMPPGLPGNRRNCELAIGLWRAEVVGLNFAARVDEVTERAGDFCSWC
jgi:hypothetical protein